MQSFEYVIKDPIGLHARPAGLLAKEAKKYQSKITLSCNGKTAEAARLMGIMGLGVKNGQTVAITIEGPDEETTAAAIKEFFETNL